MISRRDVRKLRRAVDDEGRWLARRLRAEGWTADDAELHFRDETDAEPWVAIAYMRRWERRRALFAKLAQLRK